MARAPRTSSRSTGKPLFSSKKAHVSGGKGNVAGYTKRREAQKLKSAKSGSFAHLEAASDVYEYAPDSTRRSRMRMDLDREELAQLGTPGFLDDADEEQKNTLRAKLIGEYEDDEKINSEDDEEIDSDAAFEESDEERFAGFFSAKTKKRKAKQPKQRAVRFAEVNLDEDEDVDMDQKSNDEKDEDEDEDEEEEEEDERDDSEFISLVDVLDGKGEIDTGSDNENIPPKNKDDEEKLPRMESSDEGVDEGDDDKEVNDDEEGSEDEGFGNEDDVAEEEEEEEEEDEESDKISIAGSDASSPDLDALNDLQNFISNLNPSSKKRKSPTDSSEPASSATERARKQRRVVLQERTEAGAEDEFHAQPSGSKINLDDLLAPLAAQSSSTLQSLKKATKALAPSSEKSKPLDAPLPQRAQEKLDREAAYEKTKEEVDKWSATMRRIREAEHLSFPLQAKPSGKVSNLELAAKFKPTTKLESAVDALLKTAKLRDEDIHQTEEGLLQMNNLSVEEVAQRRAELRRMRELMFRAELKAKRISKIKSRTYRKLRRKERERLEENLREASVDGEDEEQAEEGRLRREAERARERATLRHKHTGKWAKHMKGRHDEDGRKEIEDMLDRGEKLRRRIQGMRSDDESGDEDENDDDDDGEDLDDEAGLERIKQKAFDEIQRVGAEDDAEPETEALGRKSVFNMKFMKDAMARQQQQVDKMADDFIKEMGGTQGYDESGEELDAQDDPSGVVAQRIGGRVVLRPGTTPHNLPRPVSALQSLPSDTSSVTLKSFDLISPTPDSPTEIRRPALSSTSAASTSNADSTPINPWLVPRDGDRSEGASSAAKAPRKKNEIVVGKDSSTLTKSKNKIRKQARKQEAERRKTQEDAALEISTDNVLILNPTRAPSASTPATTAKGSSTTGVTVNATPSASTSQPTKPSLPTQRQTGPAPHPVEVDDAGDDSEANSEIEAQEQALTLKAKDNAGGLKAIAQRDLVALAFAGDNVVQAFEEVKRRVIAEDAPREVDTTLPGWGSWGGIGIQKAAPKPHRIKKIAGVDPKTRADYGKANIIVSEKRDKKAAKYLVKDLPYPYTSKAQFDKAMEQPIGAEWNTRLAFQRATLPKVVKKPGVIINPLVKQE